MTPDPSPTGNRGLVMLEPAADAPAVIDHGTAPALPARRRRGLAGTLPFVAAGIAVLLASWAALAAIGFIADLFARAPALGWAGVAGFGLGAALLALAAVRELRAWRALARVDRLRRVLGSDALPAMQAAARGWIASLGASLPEPQPVLEAIAAARSPDALRAALRELASAPLGIAAGRIGQRAAVDGAALVAILPHPALDALFAGLRGLAVIRRVAALYGLRPGLTVTLGLARRAAYTAAGVAGIDLITQSATDQLIGSLPGLRHLASAVTGGGLAAIRLYRLARVTAIACDPLPPA